MTGTAIKPFSVAAISALALLFGVNASAQTAAPASSSAASPMPNSAAIPKGASGGQSSAEAIENCTAKTDALLTALDRGDYVGAESDFSPSMQAGLTTAQLKSGWESLPVKFGKAGARGAPHNTLSKGYTVITIPMPFERANLAVQVACGADGPIAGFHALSLSPPPSAAAPSTAPAASSAPAPAHS